MSEIRSKTDSVGIILAAGHGRRMRSRIPKPLHPAAGKELIRYPVELLNQCGLDTIVVVASPDNQAAIASVLGESVRYAVQPQAAGTADAVSCGLASLGYTPELVMVMAADTPLVRMDSAKALIGDHIAAPNRRVTILSAEDVFGHDLGHIRRAEPGNAGSVGAVEAIVEARDRDEDFSGPAEVNTGVYCFDGRWLSQNLDGIPRSASGELYLTSLVEMAHNAGEDVAAAPFALADESLGVNDRLQLAAVTTVLRDRINCHWMREGVTIIDTATTYIDADVSIGQDTVIMPNTTLAGTTAIGQDCEIGPNATLRDSAVGDRSRVVASFLEEARVSSDVSIGPYSHLRPGAEIERGVHLGNYVEVKNARIGESTAAGHFCYLGDADIGAGVNIGAGTITCNYDGVDKHRTTVGEGAFIGSDTMLIAPVTVGPGAATGAGAVVNRNVPPAGRVVGVPARLLPPKAKERS